MALTAGGTMGSRVLGLLRESVFSAFFGTSSFAAAFIFAFQIPNLFRRLFGEGAMTAALIPVMSAERKAGGKEQAFVFLNRVLRRVLPVLIAITILAAAGSLWVAWHWDDVARVTHLDRVTDPGADFPLAARLTAALMPYMPMICVAALFTGTLNMLGRFGLTALNAVWLNVAMIVSLGGIGYLYSDNPYHRVWWLAGGAIVGGLLQLFVPVWELWRQGWRPSMNAPEPSPEAWSELKTIFLPAVIGAGVQQINLFATRFLALGVEERALAVYNVANRIVELPTGVFAVTVSTVIFASLAAHVANGDKRALAGDFAHGLRLIVAVNVAACAGIVALAEPIVRTVFEHKNFTASDTAMTVPVLMIFSATLPFYGIVGICSRTLSAMKDTKTQMKFAIRDLCLNAVLAPILGYYFKAPGLAAANLVAVIYQAYTLFRVVRRRETGIADENLAKPLLQAVVASILMGLVAYAGWRVIGYLIPRPKVASFVTLLVMIPAGATFYFGLLKLAKYPEMDELLGIARRRMPFFKRLRV